MPSPPPPIRAAIFDLDGTLIDSLGDIAASGNRMLEQLGYPTHPAAAYAQFIGDGVTMLVERALPPDAAADSTAAAEALDLYREIYSNAWADLTIPYPGIPEALTTLATAGTELAVLSNKPHDLTVQCAAHFLPETSFGIVLGQRDGVPKKPDPAGAFEIANKFGLQPNECAYIGDSDVDMHTAKAAGMLAVGVEWGIRGAEELAANGAEVLVADATAMVSALLKR